MAPCQHAPHKLCMFDKRTYADKRERQARPVAEELMPAWFACNRRTRPSPTSSAPKDIGGCHLKPMISDRTALQEYHSVCRHRPENRWCVCVVGGMRDRCVRRIRNLTSTVKSGLTILYFSVLQTGRAYCSGRDS